MGLFDDAVGAITGSSAKDAAEVQARAAAEAAKVQKEIYNQTREDLSPYRDAGQTTLKQMVGGLAEGGDFNRDFTLKDFMADPGYQFRMDEGAKALERSAAARGGLMSGGTLKELTRYGQGVASQEYGSAYDRFNADRDRRFGRLGQVTNYGLQGTQATANAGQNYANQAGEYMIGAGNAQASGIIGQANTLNNWVKLGTGAALGGGFGFGGTGAAKAVAPRIGGSDPSDYAGLGTGSSAYDYMNWGK